jgi:transposase
VADVAQKFDLTPQQIQLWKREFLRGADSVFDSKTKSKKTRAEEEKDQLLKSIGQLKVEVDRIVGSFLRNALR